MVHTRREILNWDDVHLLIDNLVRQIEFEVDALLLISRGGIIPGGWMAHIMNVNIIYTAVVDFPQLGVSEVKRRGAKKPVDVGLYALPVFLQFPETERLADKKVLIVDDVWGSGRTMSTVLNRLLSTNARAYTCVLHFNPNRNRFKHTKPDFYGAITDAYIVYPWEIEPGWHQVLRSPVIPHT